MWNVLCLVVLSEPVLAEPNRVVPVLAEPSPQRLASQKWPRLFAEVQSDQPEIRKAAWEQIKRQGTKALPLLEKQVYQRADVHSRAFQQLQRLLHEPKPRGDWSPENVYLRMLSSEDFHSIIGKEPIPRGVLATEDLLLKLADSEDLEVANAATRLLEGVALDLVTRLKAKGLKIKGGLSFLDGEVYRATLSSEWKGEGKDLIALRFLSGPVNFFGGYFGVTDGDCVRALCQVPNLRKMLIGSGVFTDDDLENLGNLQHLEGLSLSFLPITDRGLRGLSEMTKLEELYLRDLQISDETLLRLGGPGKARLKYLILHNLDITGKGLSILQGKPAPDHMDFSETRVSDAGLLPLDFQSESKYSLNVAKTPTTGRWLQTVSQKMDLEFQELNLSDTPLDDASLAYLKGSEIRTLNLSGTPVSGKGLHHLKLLKNLDNLDLSHTGVRDEDLTALVGGPSLVALKLDDTAITGAGMKSLAQLKVLRGLYVNQTRVDDAGIQHLAACERLDDLRAADTTLTGSTLKHLTHLRMEKLDLSRTRITDEALKSIGQFSELTMLKLAGTPVTNNGLKHLSGLSKLQSLDLDNTSITGAGLQHLTQLKKLAALTLNGTHITDADLIPLSKIPVEHEIQLQQTAVTPQGIRGLFLSLQKQDRNVWVHLTKTPAFGKLKAELAAKDIPGYLSLHEPEERLSRGGQMLQQFLKPFGLEGLKALGLGK